MDPFKESKIKNELKIIFMNSLLSFSLRLLLFVTLLGPSFPTLYAQTEYITEDLVPLLSQGKQFPHTTESVLLFPPRLIRENNVMLVQKLENDDIYRSFMKAHSPLLTLEISTEMKTGGVVQFKVVRENFISDWGQELSDFVLENELRNSNQILQEISTLLSEKPYLATVPHNFISALVQTLDRDINREEIFRAFERGDISVLENALDAYPKARGFKPVDFALESDRDKEYYLNVLREMMKVNEKMDLLVTTYILAWQKEVSNIEGSLEKYLIELTEEKLVWIMEGHLQKLFTDDFAETVEETRVIRRRMLFRIKNIERKIRRHQEIVTERAQVSENKLTLVEVHPSVGIFRGYIGGDCSSTLCFGYPYSPQERVFFILNKRGEDVGYLQGTLVNLNDGKRAFIINSLAGARISKEMSTIIFAGLSKAHRELGVDEVLILSRKNHLSNLDYTEIRRAFDSHAGMEVPITFSDRRFREIIDRHSTKTIHDNPDILSTGHRIENIEEIREGTSVAVSEQPFAEPPSLLDFKESDLSLRQKFFINLYHPNIAEELGINPLKDPDFAQELGEDLVEGRKLIEIIQNVDRLPTFLYTLYLTFISRHYSFHIEEFTSYTEFEYLRGLVSARDFFGSRSIFYKITIEDLERAIAKAEDPEDLKDYIIKVFPYVRGKAMGEIVERVLDFAIESKNTDLLDLFADVVFPHIRVPNKARMIEKTIKAAVTLKSHKTLTYLSYRTLPQIRIAQRKDLIEQTRSAIIALKGDYGNLLILGTFNHLGDERGWKILQPLKRSVNPESIVIRNFRRLTVYEFEQQMKILRDYFSLTPEQFTYFFGIDEILGWRLSKDFSLNAFENRILERIKEIIEFKDPELLQQLFVEIFPIAYWDGFWELVKRSIEVAIELQDHKTIKEIEKGFFLKYEFQDSPNEFETIKDLIHEFNRDSNREWGKLNSRFQAAIAPPDVSCF